MSSSPSFGRIFLVVVAGATSFYGAWQWSRGATGDDGLVVEAAPSGSRDAVSAPPARASTPAGAVILDASLAPPQRTRAAPDSKGNAFAVLDWTPPPPPVVPVAKPAPPPPPAPVAPPLPFTFVGMMEEGVGKPQAFLAQGDLLLVVAAGDTLMNNTYRVDSLSAQQILITYLPLNTQQTLNTTGRTQ
jgi:hypothetical protein